MRRGGSWRELAIGLVLMHIVTRGLAMAVSTELDRYSKPSEALALPHPSGKVVCVACAHRCKLADGKRGACLVRYRSGSAMRVPWGYTAGVAVDPIEKKPFFHVLPGSNALSFGMLGCDMHCDYCQNWFTSQTLRDPGASSKARPVTAEGLVELARGSGSRALISTYNEPLITAEWAHEVFTRAKAAGLLTGFVSNGHATTEVIEYLAPVIDVYKVDLKAFRESSYRRLGGRLQAVVDSIRTLWERGIWVEVVTLVVPGFNDDPDELGEIAGFLASVSPDLPWHVTAFHPDYKMSDHGRTSADTLVRARKAGLEEGLRYVYAGNLPGRIGGGEDTVCPSCQTVVVRRVGFSVEANRLAPGGCCPTCSSVIPGLWRAESP